MKTATNRAKELFINSLGELILNDEIADMGDLTLMQKALAKKWELVDKLIHDEQLGGIFRTSGCCKGRDATLFLTTEFAFFEDQNCSLQKIEEFAKNVGGSVAEMDVSPYIDRYKPAGGDWVEGPNHGKMNYHYAVDMKVTDLTTKQIATTLKAAHQIAKDMNLHPFYMVVL